jgi:nucleotide-binding universal stress UspA family protein
MTQSRTSIVCGVDGSMGSRAVIGVAAEFAVRLDARLVLVHAVGEPAAVPRGDHRRRELERGRAVRAGHRLLAEATWDVDAILRVTVGDPVHGLRTVSEEEDAEWVVIGSGGHVAPLLGSVAARVATSGRCPVVIVPTGAGERFARGATVGGSIICGYDGSAGSERALEAAVGLGERTGLEAVAVFVDSDRSPTATVSSPVQILRGRPVHALHERAARQDARLIALGARGRGSSRGALLGSVAAALAVTAPVPVMVVPSTARVRGLLETGDGARAVDRDDALSAP